MGGSDTGVTGGATGSFHVKNYPTASRTDDRRYTMNADSYIDTESYDDVLSHELTQFLVREAVGVAMDTPLREPILEGAERGEREFDGIEPSPESEDSGSGGRSLAGLAAFVVLFAAVYAVLRHLGGE